MTDREAILEVFSADLPETVRLMNASSVTEEIIFGRDEMPEDGELPDAVYERYERAIQELVEEGLLQPGEALGITVYGLTPTYQERRREQAVRWLANKSKNLREQVNRSTDQSRGDRLLRRMNRLDDALEALNDEDKEREAE